ncbi:MAG: hypothetical protein M1822_001121 [Bathelium mastoideum]|nr:MAG: hypothetical protein M1822_001121 [Bathelium mastoideum]
MDAQIQDQFTRVENALNTLVDSITSYNPSPAAANDLIATDDELSKGLSQLAAHQANYVRICQLREESRKLDDQIKDTMRILADLRKELLAAPATVLPESPLEIDYNDLLAYAKRISRFTVPPTYRPPAPWDIKPPKGRNDGSTHVDKEKADYDSKSPAMDETGQGNAASPALATEQNQPGVGLRDLNEPTKDWLDPLAKLPFVPWPQDSDIRNGGLAVIQHLREAGKDLTTDPRREEQEAEERKKAEEDESTRRDKERAEQRQSQGVGTNGHRASRQEDTRGAFSLDLYDPDEG